MCTAAGRMRGRSACLLVSDSADLGFTILEIPSESIKLPRYKYAWHPSIYKRTGWVEQRVFDSYAGNWEWGDLVVHFVSCGYVVGVSGRWLTVGTRGLVQGCLNDFGERGRPQIGRERSHFLPPR
jgi:galactosyl transferase GMA12/MNN10 family